MNKAQGLSKQQAIYLLLFIFLIALNLRGPVTGLAPLLERIKTDLLLNSSQSGLLTSLPLLAFAFFAPVASWLSRHFQIERILALSIGCILLGMVIRSFGLISSLFLGSVFIGAGIAIGNVMLPSLLKREFPNHIIQLTALYVLMMSVGGFVMSSSAVPLSSLIENQTISLPMSSWSFALACQSIMILLPILVWFKLDVKEQIPSSVHYEDANVKMWRSKTAWQVASFLAMNSLINYIVVTWISSILVSYGYGDSTAGLYQGYLQLAGALPSVLLAPFMHKFKSHLKLCFLATGLTFLSILGFCFVPTLSVLWSITFGFGISMGYILGLSFVGIRTRTPKQASALSAMSQLIGYTLAALGPVLIGALYDWRQAWDLSLYSILLLCFIWIFLGWLASPKTTES